jgi:hypothetical protein
VSASKAEMLSQPQNQMTKVTQSRAQTVINDLLAVLASGTCVNRAFVVHHFAEAGYADHLATRHADDMIALLEEFYPGIFAN